jgi:hypothetical protein
MVLASIISGAGATASQDGWHAVGPECCFGALTSGDIEMLEHSYPIIIHRYELMEDSGGAGRNRGGSGTCWEVEPLDAPMTLITFGEGRRIPAMGAAGAKSTMIESKVGRLELTRNGGVETSATVWSALKARGWITASSSPTAKRSRSTPTLLRNCAPPNPKPLPTCLPFGRAAALRPLACHTLKGSFPCRTNIALASTQAAPSPTSFWPIARARCGFSRRFRRRTIPPLPSATG